MVLLKYSCKRILMLIPVVVGISLFIFVIMSLAPGDAASLILGDAHPDLIEELREEMGLNDPIIVQYLRYMAGVVRGDFGFSWFHGFDVLEEFVSRLPNTFILGFLAMGIVTFLGVPLGIAAAVRQNSLYDYSTLVWAMLFMAIPTFWFGLMTQVLFSLVLGWFPATGADSLRHFVLPSIALAAAGLGGMVRLTRTSMLDVNKLDYVRTARAKGASENRIIYRHVLRNGMLPVANSVGGQLAGIISGAVVTETVFSIPGVATLLLNAVRMRDIPVVLGVLIIVAAFVGFVNLLVDLTFALIDPRVKFS